MNSLNVLKSILEKNSDIFVCIDNNRFEMKQQTTFTFILNTIIESNIW